MMTFFKRAFASVVLAVLAIAQSAAPTFAATEPPGTLSVLFVGNSFIHGKFPPVLNYNAAAVTDENAGLPASDPRAETNPTEPPPWGGIAGIFAQLARETGRSYDVHLEAISGKSLAYHAAHALSIIARRWDIVVLQELSTGPLTASRSGNPESFLASTTLLEQTIHRANPAAKIFFYETWPRADLTYPPGKPYSGQTIQAMGDDLHAGYAQVFERDGRLVAVAPAGDAWLHAIRDGIAEANPYAAEAGKLDLWGPDNYHPSRYGAYLNALVIFRTITGVDPQTLGSAERAASDLGIPPETARALQRLAATTPD